MTPRPTARQHAREQMTASIVGEARRQLAVSGAAALSLRSVARELGVVSSAVYRYVASRDDLLTRLIVAAYDSLGDAVDQAVADSVGAAPADRWAAVAHAIRQWALPRPHEYFLVFGTPVPGYVAPAETALSGTRAPRALVHIVANAHAAEPIVAPNRQGATLVSEALAADFETLRTNVEIDADLTDETLLAVLVGWTQMFGLLSFELSNQTRGVVTDHRALFDAAVRLMAVDIGLV